MKKRPATITDRERKREIEQASSSRHGIKSVCYLHETNFHDDFILHLPSGLARGKPVFKICVQKHSTHRFPALPVDVAALLDSADPKLKVQEVICSQLIRANKSGTPAFISGVPLFVYLQEAGGDNSISLFCLI